MMQERSSAPRRCWRLPRGIDGPGALPGILGGKRGPLAIDFRANVAKTVQVDAHAGTVTSPSPSHAHANGRGPVHVNVHASGLGTRSMGRHEGSAVPRSRESRRLPLRHRLSCDGHTLRRRPATRRGQAARPAQASLHVDPAQHRDIAESCGKTSAPERARFLSIARGSALECGAILDVAVATGVLDPTPVRNARCF
jgi:hypothetical protein